VAAFVLAVVALMTYAAILMPPTTRPTTTAIPLSSTTSSTPTGGPTPGPTFSSTHAPVGVGNVTVHFINVGQGDSIFIDTSQNDVLIDGGPEPAGRDVAQYLFHLNITRIDIVIATHPHEDHIGGLIVVMQEFDLRGYAIQTVYDSGFKADTQTYKEYITLAQKRTLITAERGQGIQLDSTSLITVLNPTQPPPFEDTNDNSVVVRLQVNTISFLFTGDAEKDAEQGILKAQLDVKSNILKIGHHGSSTSTSLDFLRAVKPEVAVISVGKDNRYGHPDQNTLARLTAEGVEVCRTDLDGTITVSTDGTKYSVRTLG
jgi:beta-lactamase superfamily II metal-dependent hydrolase